MFVTDSRLIENVVKIEEKNSILKSSAHFEYIPNLNHEKACQKFPSFVKKFSEKY